MEVEENIVGTSDEPEEGFMINPDALSCCMPQLCPVSWANISAIQPVTVVVAWLIDPPYRVVEQKVPIQARPTVDPSKSLCVNKAMLSTSEPKIAVILVKRLAMKVDENVDSSKSESTSSAEVLSELEHVAQEDAPQPTQEQPVSPVSTVLHAR